MKEYIGAVIAGMWLADGVALLLAPSFNIHHVRAAIQIKFARWPWRASAAIGGVMLFWTGLGLRYQALWIGVAGAMVCKGLFLALAPAAWRDRLLTWTLAREEVDYRFWGLGLCALAVLLLHALGWIGKE